jgi:serine phosphatase RsbU (regulator of sigma subunit)
MKDPKSKNTDDLNHIYQKHKKELTQSLKYASYIQKALLPNPQALERNFPDHFLLFEPRDIVSGDFYWQLRKKDLLYFAIGDCTGHGVPGAFLSILGISFLNQIVDRNEKITAADVLNHLREYIMKALQQTGEEHEQKDGIDMALCVIDHQKQQLQFAGAFNPLYVIKNSNRLIEVPGDKMPIGIAAEVEITFKNHIIELESGDIFYMFSDGFVDQFGGREGKKYKYRPFRNLLLNICNLPMAEQKAKLLSTLQEWKGTLPQLDDITIFGSRFR